MPATLHSAMTRLFAEVEARPSITTAEGLELLRSMGHEVTVAAHGTTPEQLTAAVLDRLEDATNGQTADALDHVIARLTEARNRAQTQLDATDAEDDEPSDEFCEGYSATYYGTDALDYDDPADRAEYQRGVVAAEARIAREEPTLAKLGVEVKVTRSAGSDGAVVVFVDTTFEPDASDGGPGLRVLVNDADVTEPGCAFVAYQSAAPTS